MSMSLSVYGIVPPDDKWFAMKAVYDACTDAKIEPPKEVRDFFDGTKPDPKGVVIDLYRHACVKKYTADYQDGYVVDLETLPQHIKHLRFVMS